MVHMNGNSSSQVNIALALGANVGDRLGMLRAAVAGLASYMHVTTISPVYETAPVYVTDQPLFLNAVVLGKAALEPLALLWSVKQLEIELGRTPTFRYGPRAIDIDILFHDDHVIASPELTLPHPRMCEREFVLRPLADVAKSWKHPQTSLTVAEMLVKLPTENPKCVGALLPDAA
jgi:2-amino-4-hydroxy-6-hydroxymethyldihydropteridine diphosphokinase